MSLPTLLYQSASKNNIEIVKRALDGEFGSVNEDEINDALLVASRRGYIEVVQILLNNGADINYGADDDTCLTYAVRNNLLRLFRLLISKGADVNQTTDSTRRSPLHRSCYCNIPVIAEELIQAGANVNARDVHMTTPLIAACQAGNKVVVQNLLDTGSRPNFINNSDKESALHLAAKNGHFDCIKVLIKHGVELNLKNCWGQTPLICSLIRGYEKSAKILLEAGSDAHVIDDSSKTALHYATHGNMYNITLALLMLGVDIDIVNSTGNVPLVEATYNDNVQMVNLLLQVRTDVHIYGRYTINGNYKWYSPLEIAILQNQNVIMASLLIYVGHSVEPLKMIISQGIVPEHLLQNDIFMEWAYSVISEPQSLFNITSCFIRSYLGLNVVRKILKMFMPQPIKELLTLHRFPFEWDWNSKCH